jgi:hypothetical protein
VKAKAEVEVILMNPSRTRLKLEQNLPAFSMTLIVVGWSFDYVFDLSNF